MKTIDFLSISLLFRKIIVAYYGRPGVKSLGVLGQQHPIEQLKPMIKKKAAKVKHPPKRGFPLVLCK
ncbi:hypothetical protein [Sulfurovum riftiae]|uniref:hypothetical protein n=1 Tax=Sulfurovum riftiae TaxID=1630136 RepID=UPI000ABA08C5|nr:hypothetical protein [Sulfurovum riftiae]